MRQYCRAFVTPTGEVKHTATSDEPLQDNVDVEDAEPLTRIDYVVGDPDDGEPFMKARQHAECVSIVDGKVSPTDKMPDIQRDEIYESQKGVDIVEARKAVLAAPPVKAPRKIEEETK